MCGGKNKKFRDFTGPCVVSEGKSSPHLHQVVGGVNLIQIGVVRCGMGEGGRVGYQSSCGERRRKRQPVLWVALAEKKKTEICDVRKELWQIKGASNRLRGRCLILTLVYWEGWDATVSGE